MTALPLAPTQSDILTALRSFLLAILPTGVSVIQAQDNRVPEPAGTDFVMMTPILRARIATNIEGYVDNVFTGSIAGDTMTISVVSQGTLGVGSTIFGTGVATGTEVTALAGGTGGVGNYTVAPSQMAGSQTLAAGVDGVLQETRITVQLDVHGPGSADNAQTISTLFRDDYAYEFFVGLNQAISPLYADDPKQIPFINDQNQYETRWIVEAVLQANQTVTVPQQFAAAVTVGLIDVDAVYPP